MRDFLMFSYCINWDDIYGALDTTTCLETVTTTTASHAWLAPGVYTIYFKAFNTISEAVYEKTITILGSIESLDFAVTIPAVITHELSNVDLLLSGSGDANVDISFVHANGTEEFASLNVTLQKYYFLHIEKSFSYPQDVYCNITARHPRLTLNQADYIYVEDSITVFELETNTTGATLNSSLYRIYEHQGTNVSYYWQWDEFESDNTTYVREMNHTYMTYGNKTINITAYNKVSEKQLSFIYEIQDTLMGLEYIGETHIFTEFERPTIIVFKLKEGTGISCWVNFNTTNDTSFDLLSPVSLDVDIVNRSSFMIGLANYTYVEKGIYNVTVMCENDISSERLSHIMPVENKITNFRTNFYQEFNGTEFYDWVEENETLTLTAEHDNLGEVFIVYDVGDGRPNTTTTNMSFTFSYPRWSEKLYVMIITAYNQVDRVNHTNYTWVPRPVKNMTGFQLFHSPENSTEQMAITLNITTGDYFNCSWNFSDGSDLRYVPYQEYVDEEGVVLHQFKGHGEDVLVPGMYDVQVNCSSRLYENSANAIVSSYNPVSFFLIELFSECPGKNRTEAFGDRSNLFPVVCDVIFVISEQTGTNVSYEFSYGYNNETTSQPITSVDYNVSEVYHRFKFEQKPTDESWDVMIRINASNTVSSRLQTIPIRLISAIMNVSISGDTNDVMANVYPANFSIYVANFGYEACYEVDFDGDTFTDMVFGADICANKEEYTYVDFLKNVKLKAGGILKNAFSYMYKLPALNIVTITARNVLSSVLGPVVTQIKVKVIDYPCFKPEIKWTSAIAKTADAVYTDAPFYKCLRYPVLTKAIPNCQKPNTTIKRTWFLKKIKDKYGTDMDPPQEFEMPGNITSVNIGKHM